MRPFVIEFLNEGVELGLLLQDVGAGRAGGFLLQSQMHALMPAVLLRMAGANGSMVMPSRSHHTESLESLNSPFGEAKGNAIVRADRLRQTALFE